MERQLKQEIPDQLARIMEIYNGMNTVGQEKIFDYAIFLSESPKYGKKMIPFPHTYHVDR